jgi:hypothetical protein
LIYTAQVAEEILNLQSTKSYRHSEKPSAYGKSRQVVYVYLEELASVGMIGATSKGTLS